MRTPIMAGNWKMHKTVGEAVAFVKELSPALSADGAEVVVCPPFTALQAVHTALEGGPIELGAQNVYYEKQGAYTGEVAPPMLLDVGCSYVIIGHSERRQYFGETDESVNRKLHILLEHKLRPIVCIGESKPQRDVGQAEIIVTNQVRAGLKDVAAECMPDIVLAYEPIWAIGTGDTATPADAQAMHAAIRQTLVELYGDDIAAQVRIQYGGSVKPDNIDELMACADIDGALVGGASLKVDSFLRIIQFQPLR
jgi:triosephosphate isomerase (TIM)